MTVLELKEALKNIPDDEIVVMSKDGEGNSFSPLYEVFRDEKIVYEPDSTWSGDLVKGKLTGKRKRCIVLYPTN